MNNSKYVEIGKLKIVKELYNFINEEVVSGLDIQANDFFLSLSQLIDEMQGENLQLLHKRDKIQQKIDKWHLANQEFNFKKYKDFLKKIDYLLPEPANFTINTSSVDEEITSIAGAQLVVPISSARFALNALNARWGSLYDALYGTNVIANEGKNKIGTTYNEARGTEVINWSNDFLDKTIPLSSGSYSQINSITVQDNNLVVLLQNNQQVELKNKNTFIGYNNTNILLKNNNLHIELVVDKNTLKITDVLLESAITTIIDFEDSVATIANDEKIQAYRNFLGLNKRDLQEIVPKNGKDIVRKLNSNKTYTAKNGENISLSATSLMLVRNVGHHMFTGIVKFKNAEIAEGILDAMITTLIALHDIKNLHKNSKTGSMYIVKPKMHGADEVAFTVKMFGRVEELLGLKNNTIKIGIMDEERRTSLNLKKCIEVAKDRVIFINTGFLDRTGDEIHTSMLAGVMVAKNDIKKEQWLDAYEKLNVKTGLDCGFYQNAQIGKGMWAQPEQMQEMLEQKISHLQMGANCSWVPSPTAATLHATHYHQYSVFQRQTELKNINDINPDDLLIPPILKDTSKLTQTIINNELNNNAQSILGYVVRWIDQGIGCSKVKDINDIGLMEDRATLRISSQHMGNWLYHQICSKKQVEQAFKDMAIIVDKQNANDLLYKNIAPNYNSNAFKAALELVYKATTQPNGYTEEILRKYRQLALEDSK